MKESFREVCGCLFVVFLVVLFGSTIGISAGAAFIYCISRFLYGN